MRRTIAAIMVSLCVTTVASAADIGEVVVQENVLRAGHERYIVVLERNVAGAARQIAAEVVKLGGTVEADLGNRLVITIAPEGIASIRQNAAIKFIESTALGAPPEDDPMEPLAMSVPALPVQPNTGQTWKTGDYTYDGAGNIATIGTSTLVGTQGYRTYGYDAVSRLTTAQISGVAPGGTYEYGYDVYGNRTSYAINGQSTSISVSAATNRLAGATYDSSGNQKAQGVTSATYDGFNMATSYHFDGSNVETYVYTADDERIGVLRGTEWTWSLRDPGGKVIRQYRSSSTNSNVSWVWVEDFVYRDGLLLGSERVAEEGGRRHYHIDHLGSPRLVTGANGSVISEHDFLPFGEERTTIAQHQARGYDREEPLRFTGHERDFDNTTPNDSSAYIDYMHARYYGAGMGRFLSVDPVFGDPGEPQSWNRYAYVLNNPIKFVDPLGLSPEDKPGETITVEADSPETEARKRREAEALRNVQLEMLMFWLKQPSSTQYGAGEKLNWLPRWDGNNVNAFFSSAAPNTILIDAHGSSARVNRMEGLALAARIRREAQTLKPGTTIILNSCNAAAGDNSIAEQLSVLLPTNPVIGYDRQRWTFGVDLGTWGKLGGRLPNFADPGRAWIFVNGVGTSMEP